MADDFVTIADHVADALDLSDAQVSDLRNAAPLVSRLPAEEASNGTVHKYSKETGAPTVGFRDENDGREYDHSVDTAVSVNLEILDWSFKCDKAVADAWRKGGAPAYLAREGFRHVKAAMFTLEKQYINGTVTGSGGSSAGFTGMANSADLNQLADEMVVNGGGSTANTGSSVYFIRISPDGVLGVYKGDGSVVEMGDTVIVPGSGSSTGELPTYYTPATAWFGMQVGGKYDIGRICNLTEDANDGLTDDKCFELLSRFPASMRSGLVAVCSTRSVRQLRESRTATNATGAPAPWPTTVANGIPIIETDAVVNTEALLT